MKKSCKAFKIPNHPIWHQDMTAVFFQLEKTLLYFDLSSFLWNLRQSSPCEDFRTTTQGTSRLLKPMALHPWGR